MGDYKIWLLSDIHFGLYSNSLNWLEITDSFFVDFLIPTLKESVFDKERECIFVLGDVFDSRQSINTQTLNHVIRNFKKLRDEIGIPIYILCGNHDIYFKSTTDISSLIVLESIVDKVFYTPEIFTFGNRDILIQPWDSEVDSIIQRINKVESLDYVFGHLEIKGFSYNPITVIDGEEAFDPLSLSNKNLKGILSGHIHTGITKTVNNIPITYLGSPYQMNRGDNGVRKGIHCLNLNNDSITFFENTISPKFIVINFNQLMVMDYDDYLSKVKNNFIDIILNKNQYVVFPHSKLIEITNGHRNIRFIRKDEIRDSLLEDSESGEDVNFIGGVLDTSQSVLAWVSDKGINDTYKQSVVNVILNYLQEIEEESVSEN